MTRNIWLSYGLAAAIVLAGLGAFAAAQKPGVKRGRRPMPKITKPVMFDTPEADRILSTLQVFPPDNAWNRDVSKWPVAANSAPHHRLDRGR